MTDLLTAPTPNTTAMDYFLQTVDELRAKVDWLVVATTEDAIVAIDLRKELKAVENDIEKKRVDMVKPMNDYVSQINTKAKEIKEPVLSLLSVVDKKIKDYQAEQDRIAAQKRKEEQERIDAERKEREEKDRIRRDAEEKKRQEEEAKIAEQKRIADEKMKAAQEASDEVEKKRLEEEAKIAAEREKLEKEKRDYEEMKRKDQEAARQRLEDEKREREEIALSEVAKWKKAKGIKTRRKFVIEDESLVPVAYKTVDEKKIRSAITAWIRTIEWVKIFEERWF